MKNKKLLTVLIALVVLATGIGIGALAASSFGTQSDPLITKSYLDTVLTPALQSQFQTQLNSRADQLERQISNISGGDPANFIVVGLSSGDVLKGAAGCEIILTDGAASVSGSGLSDITSGGAVSNGSAMTANHMYVVSVAGSGVAADGTVSLLVRGSYTVS
jgi:hypothetical protein